MMHGQQNVKCRYILHRTGTWYNCLPEEKPSVSKHVQAEENKIKFNVVAFSWSTLCVYHY